MKLILTEQSYGCKMIIGLEHKRVFVALCCNVNCVLIQLCVHLYISKNRYSTET